MKTVITYGTYDLLHYGHIRLLERAKQLGDYLIVGVTADDFDKKRGKINVQQTLMERIEAVKATGLVDKIIVEEYEGQKIDDIKRYNVDIFTVGSDWEGKFDYLKEYCEVKYLERTQGVSSSEIRSAKRALKMGLVGNHASMFEKFQIEDIFVNGVEVIGICTDKINQMNQEIQKLPIVTDDYDELLKKVDAVYINSDYHLRYIQIKKALQNKKHVLCESPMCMKKEQYEELMKFAKEQDCILIESIKTAYCTAFNRLLLLLKTGKIGRILSVDVSCTSIKKDNDINSFKEWGPTCLLAIFQILGTNYKEKKIVSYFNDREIRADAFTKVDFVYNASVASLKVAEKAKSEGALVVTGTKGYIYVPAPWWKTEYFEVRFEDQNKNKRYYYQLEGEGIRYELVIFIRSIQEKKNLSNIDEKITSTICDIMNDFNEGKDLIEI